MVLRYILDFLFGSFIFIMFITESIDWLLDRCFVILRMILEPLCHHTDLPSQCVDMAQNVTPVQF